MENYNAYHITNIRNITSIYKFGLVPNYGSNSRYVKDLRKSIFFTSFQYINFWKNQFNYKEEEMIVLNFDAENEGKRINEHDDFYTTKHIKPEEIFVINNNKRIPLGEFYTQNKIKFEEEYLECLKSRTEDILIMLKKILLTEDKKYTIDNCSETLDYLANVMVLENINDFKSYLIEIKNITIELFKINNLDKYNIYIEINNIFERIINKDKNLLLSDIFDLQYKIYHGFDYDEKKINTFNNIYNINGNIKNDRIFKF